MYMLEYQESPLPEWRTLVTGIPTTRYRVMHLYRKRDYNFRVRALTPYGVSPPSPAQPVTMMQTPVTRGLPEKVIISEVEPHSLRLTWRRPMYDLDKPINYQVEMLESPFSEWRPIATRVLETTYKVTGLKPTRDYQFRVIPHVDTRYLAPSPSAALTTMPVSLTCSTYHTYECTFAVRNRHHLQSYVVVCIFLSKGRKIFIMSSLNEAPKFALKEPSIRDISQNIVHLTWTPAEIPDSTESISYMVEMQTPPGISTWSVLHRKHPSPSVRLADFRPDLDYLVRVRAQCGSYRSEPTHPVYIPRRAEY
ncbi:roundabout homolog 2-like isoform X2 [Mercenaria mercenaria]|uniref:roundabout homolog 2-like isoform X2 n=1 Tax=Mercenaria mercenaria TaxID=6596 RepID=UPI00234E9EED|nr:roundabout homolog 2-like isoform X2 [Mercenaria mercenaria]